MLMYRKNFHAPTPSPDKSQFLFLMLQHPALLHFFVDCGLFGVSWRGFFDFGQTSPFPPYLACARSSGDACFISCAKRVVANGIPGLYEFRSGRTRAGEMHDDAAYADYDAGADLEQFESNALTGGFGQARVDQRGAA